MSKITLEPNASGAGTFTLAAPDSNTNRTLTLPDASGTVATVAIISFLVGQVCFFAMDTAPDGFLKANGAEVSRSTYADLFAAIGTTFGSGDGSNTFNLPDMRGEFPRGWDDGRGVDSGRAFGSAQIDQMQRHKHRIRGRGRGSTVDSFSGSANPANGFANSGIYNTGVMPDNSYAQDGGGTPRTGSETRPRNIALLACIKF